MSYFRAENLSLHFGGLKAVDAVSFAVEKGEILSIIGPNGAGKSSIFNLVSRIATKARPVGERNRLSVPTMVRTNTARHRK